LPHALFLLSFAENIMRYRFGAFCIDAERLEIRKDDVAVPVQPQVFELLVYLLENRERVVPKDDLIEAVWEGRAVSDGTLNARINAARRALDDTGDEQAVIRTFPRRGFRFVAELMTGAVAADPRPPEMPVATGPDPQSIAVLPFVNMSGDQDQEYFADGLTEDLITDLSKIPGLFVIARNSSFAFKGKAMDMVELGDKLGVAHVLEGSVRKAGRRVRINAQLIDAATGGHLWAERYDGDLEDIFALQDDITGQIIEALRGSLAGTHGANRQTESVAAYELSLRARAKFFMFSPETNRECIDLYNQAIEVDPNFADAWAGLVFPYQSGWSFLWPGYDDGLTIAVEKAERAVELAPSSSLAQSRLGWVQTFLNQPDKSVASFEKALAIDPYSTDALAFYSECLNFAGDPSQALEIGAACLKYDPVTPINCVFHIGHAHFLLGHLEEAAQSIGSAIEMAPDFPVARMIMAATQAELGNLDQAAKHLNHVRLSYPAYNSDTFNARYPYADPAHRQRVLTGLRQAGLPDP